MDKKEKLKNFNITIKCYIDQYLGEGYEPTIDELIELLYRLNYRQTIKIACTRYVIPETHMYYPKEAICENIKREIQYEIRDKIEAPNFKITLNKGMVEYTSKCLLYQEDLIEEKGDE